MINFNGLDDAVSFPNWLDDLKKISNSRRIYHTNMSLIEYRCYLIC